MKTLPLLLLINLFVIQNSYSQNNVVINGIAKKHSINEIQLGKFSSKIDSLGNFVFLLNISEPVVYTLKYNRNETELFVQPNDTIRIVFSEPDFYETILFKGKTAFIQQFLVDIATTGVQIDNYFNTKWNEFSSLSEDKYVEKVNELRGQLVNPIEKFIKENQNRLNPWFIKYCRLSVNFGFDRLIYIYPSIYYDYVSLEYQLSFRDRYKYNEEFNQNDKDLLRIENYYRLMKSILRLKVIESIVYDKSLRNSDNQWITAYQKSIIKSFRNETIRDYWLHYYLNDHIDNFGVKNLDKIVEEFNNYCTNKVYRKEINDYYQAELTKRQGHLIKTYKEIDGFKLDAHIFIPKDIEAYEKRPAIVYFHGGGFSSGKPDWHFGYNKDGFISIAVEYRIYDRHGVMPFEEISDAKSFIRWLRKNANEFHVDENKIIASGNSAGAALIITTALLDSLDEPYEDLTISSKPNAMILNASGYDQTNKFGPVKDKSSLAKISGINIVKPNAPPCLVIHGSNDRGIPIKEAETFVTKMRAAGNICEFKVLEGAGHVPWLRPPYSIEASKARKDFLKQLGYINE